MPLHPASCSLMYRFLLTVWSQNLNSTDLKGKKYQSNFHILMHLLIWSFPFLVLILECSCLHLPECNSVCSAGDGTQGLMQSRQVLCLPSCILSPKSCFSSHFCLRKHKMMLPGILICFMMLEYHVESQTVRAWMSMLLTAECTELILKTSSREKGSSERNSSVSAGTVKCILKVSD